MILTTLLAIATPTILLTTFSPTAPSQMDKMITPPASNFMMGRVRRMEMDARSWAYKVEQEHGVATNQRKLLSEIMSKAGRSEGHAVVAYAKLCNLEAVLMKLFYDIPYRDMLPSIENRVAETIKNLKEGRV